jgi:4-amino-4-deoxy-L-arabinose transferase-like glycosyltransferase
MVYVAKKHGLMPVWLGLVVVGLLLPFLGKAIHMDDPLFLWTARHIQSHPLDFFGFQVNWYGYLMPMAEVMKNPPLFSYYLALVTALFGWSEPVIHLANYLAAFGVAVGVFFLAEELGIEPVAATLASVFTPVFLVSATTVMCDTMMLAWWMWAMVFWLRGLRCRRSALLIAGALCIAAGFLTKFFAISLVPLLLLYTLFNPHRPAKWYWLVILLSPLLVVAGYQVLTVRLYGLDLFNDAAAYSLTVREESGGRSRLFGLLLGLSFSGGGILSFLFLTPFMGRKLALGAAAAGGVAVVLVLMTTPVSVGLPLLVDETVNWYLIVHLTLFVMAGFGLLLLAGHELMHTRDRVSLLLVLWLGGTLLFAGCLNWTMSARNILPMAPAAGLLLSRAWRKRSLSPSALTVGLLLSMTIGLAATWADYCWANTNRRAVNEIAEDMATSPGTSWFQGHWGFQYYMEQAGARPVNVSQPALRPGDLVISPTVNTNLYLFNSNADFSVRELRRIALTPLRWASTLDITYGSGFYSSLMGPVPFMLGPTAPLDYHIFLCSRVATTGAAAPTIQKQAPEGQPLTQDHLHKPKLRNSFYNKAS